ncbi:hypothetical protein [Gallibacterium salpingitidis]|uniref:Chemotaxis protein n=1 Tax=Gallibacterium salpingitidis TaxID=505341 RepID=A0A1A7P250_9PAST|nr:hypothetical protein [Gallibacterium salpingitidis]OBW95304.1 hypothetical protein QS62_04085 [Gallibacterium salpingitidis]
MKLVIKQYLSSLKERGELEVLLPELLSQMGFEVFLKPGIGSRQYGVDIAAYGSLSDSLEKKVYLFCVKGGDLDRTNWNGSTPQDVRPSIEEILDVFIDSHIPVQYKSASVEICLCFGGDIKENIRQSVTSYMRKMKEKYPDIDFSEWNGDYLSSLVERYFLREELLPKNSDCRGLLRKSLAMINEPDMSYKYFKDLIKLLANFDELTIREQLTRIRQIYLSLYILYSWSKSENNLESVFLSSEFTILYTWDIVKVSFDNKRGSGDKILNIFYNVITLYLTILREYIKNKILPYVDIRYGLSNAVGTSCDVAINMKLFDVLGRLSLYGLWLIWYRKNVISYDQELADNIDYEINKVQASIIKFINNNPILFTPYKEEQVIDLSLAYLFLSSDPQAVKEFSKYIYQMCICIKYMFSIHGKYPSVINNYEELLEHPLEKTDQYREKITQASVLFPHLAIFSALMMDDESYKNVQCIIGQFLFHCNLQIYFFNELSEEYFYRNIDSHGAVLNDFNLNKEQSDFLKFISDECERSDEILKKMSAIAHGYWPLILAGCRHYNLPIPINFMFNDF